MGISNYEKQYMTALQKIYYTGFADGENERTGKQTKRLPGIVMQIDVEKEFPILKSKFVAGKTALREILWIWQCQSNNIHDLKAHIWDEWADKNGSIGKAYGYQMNRPVCIYTDPVNKTPESFRTYENQAKFIIEYLREFPNGRWGVSTIWNPEQLSGMNLVPCCHTSTWNLDGGRLNCLLDQRSGDMPYGVPFNTTQYAELMILFARDLGVKPGILTHVIADAHIYDNQMDGVEKQLAYYELLCAVDKVDRHIVKNDSTVISTAKLASYKSHDERGLMSSPDALIETAMKALESEPMFVMSDTTDFFAVNGDDCYVDNYESMGKIDFGEVAV